MQKYIYGLTKCIIRDAIMSFKHIEHAGRNFVNITNSELSDRPDSS